MGIQQRDAPMFCLPRARFHARSRVLHLDASATAALRRASINPSWHANNSWKKSTGHAAATLQLITRTVAATRHRLPELQFVTAGQARTAILSNCVDNARGFFPLCLVAAIAPRRCCGDVGRWIDLRTSPGSRKKSSLICSVCARPWFYQFEVGNFRNNLMIRRIYTLFWYFIYFILFIKNTCIFYSSYKTHSCYM